MRIEHGNAEGICYEVAREATNSPAYMGVCAQDVLLGISRAQAGARTYWLAAADDDDKSAWRVIHNILDDARLQAAEQFAQQGVSVSKF